MRLGIERRVEVLESQRSRDDGPTIILRSIVSPGAVDAPRSLAESDGMLVLRLADEADDEFEARAQAEIMRTLPGRSAYRIHLHGSDASNTGSNA